MTTRVVHIINDSSAGGAQTLVEALAANEHEEYSIDALVLRGPGSLDARLRDVCQSVQHYGMPRDSNDLIGAVRWIRQQFVRLDPNIVHTHLLHSDLAGLLASGSRPVVWTLHSTGYNPSDPRRTRLLSRVNGLLSRSVHQVVACTEEARTFAYQQGYSRRNMTVINNGVRIPAVHPISRDTLRFVHVARWHPMKDYANLLRATARVAERLTSEFACFGDGITPENAELTQMRRQYAARTTISLNGYTPSIDIALEGATALVISSAYGEALPMVGVEALARGVPVVTTDVGGCPQLVVRPWMLVRPGSPSALGDALVRLGEVSDTEYQQITADARALAVRRFNIEDTVRKYSAVYHRLESRAPREP